MDGAFDDGALLSTYVNGNSDPTCEGAPSGATVNAHGTVVRAAIDLVSDDSSDSSIEVIIPHALSVDSSSRSEYVSDITCLSASSNTSDGASPWKMRKIELQSIMTIHGATRCISFAFGGEDSGRDGDEHHSKTVSARRLAEFRSNSAPVADFAHTKTASDHSIMRTTFEPHMTRFKTTRALRENNGTHQSIHKRRVTHLEGLSEERLGSVLHVLTTHGGAEVLRRYEKFIFREQPQRGSDAFLCTASHSKYICEVVPDELWCIDRIHPLPERFTSLFGLTAALWCSGTWTEVVEERKCLKAVTRNLAGAWSALLGHGDAVLGMDPHFTRPAVEAMLEDIETRLGEHAYNFHWRPMEQP